MDVHEKVEKIVDKVLEIYPAAKIFRKNIINGMKQISAPDLFCLVLEIKQIIEEE